MPELAEVEYFRRQWNPGLGARVTAVLLHPAKRPLRGLDVSVLSRALTGSTFDSSIARGKQMLFRFSGDVWIGLHLGMTGSLRVEPARFVPLPHDHFVMRQRERTLVFSDPRGFGRVLFHRGPEAPAWWTRLPPPPHDPSFTIEHFRGVLRRHVRAPLKAVLLRQDRFAGVGNWMADEILWRAQLHPQTRPAQLDAANERRLWREIRFVCRGALRIVAKDYSDPPASWLFPHRWKDGGFCPRDATELRRATVGGRTTAWCPRCQAGIKPS
jgi:formamidopyrimidine-DNA glycosylase